MSLVIPLWVFKLFGVMVGAGILWLAAVGALVIYLFSRKRTLKEPWK